MDNGLLHLVYKGFNSAISTNWMELREESEFFDVTLACAGSMVKAHKVILSSCSPVLKELIIQTQHPHPILYLRGVKHEQINALLDFVYKGEVNVARDDLDDFLDVTKELKIKGLADNGDGKQTKEFLVNTQNLVFNNMDPDTSIKLKDNDEDLIKDEPRYHEREDVGRPPIDYKEDICKENNDKAPKSSSAYKFCQFCAKKVSKKANEFQKHLEVVHGHVKKNLYCPYCFERKEDYRDLTMCRQKHKNDQFWTYPSEFKCNDEDCSGVIYSGTSVGRKSFMTHNRKRHGMEFKVAPSALPPVEFSCRFCKKLFARGVTLKKHEDNRCPENPAINDDTKDIYTNSFMEEDEDRQMPNVSGW